MHAQGWGGALHHHRARLFPLPLLPTAAPPPHKTCARIRFRFKVRRLTTACTNECVFALNRLYNSPSFACTYPPLSFPHLLSGPVPPVTPACTGAAPAPLPSAVQSRIFSRPPLGAVRILREASLRSALLRWAEQ